MQNSNKAAKDALKKKAPARAIVTDEYASPVEGEFQGKLEYIPGIGRKQPFRIQERRPRVD